MALGHSDTDRVYDGAIKPALKEVGLTPRRIDRIEHNEDIDDKIIEELKACDLAVVDLTYARPSVYYEAGYAERAVKVIYTCRRDHLSPKADDPLGSLRVHFDLQMRNIVCWKSPSDAAFKRKLAARLRLVARPLLASRERSAELEGERRLFAMLAPQERDQAMLTIAARRLRRMGFGQMPLDRKNVQRYVGWWAGQRETAKGTHRAYVFTPRELSRSALTTNNIYTWGVPAVLSRGFDSTAVGRRKTHILLLSHVKRSLQRLSKMLTSFRVDQTTNSLWRELDFDRTGSITVTRFYLVDNVQSGSECANRITKLLKAASWLP